jgi:Lon protease-like protein
MTDLPSSSLPLFPLKTVLVPGASLALRVFEPRYLDLVRECGRNGSTFGVCLLLDGEEAGIAASTAAVGTEAAIEDFGTGDDGLLALHVRGRRRFQARRTRVRDNGLVVATVDWRDADADDELRPEHAVLGQVLRHILEQVGGEHAQAAATRLDDAAWVGWRLVELLPLSDRQRQALLQQDDPHVRLDELLALVS